jgi:hypothetical protein
MSTQQVPYAIRNNYNLGEDYAEGPTIKVKCIAPQGLYYDFQRRREGDVFTLYPKYVTVIDRRNGKPLKKDGIIQKKLITAKEQFSEYTMEIVADDTPEHTTTSQQAINKAQVELDAAKGASKGGR